MKKLKARVITARKAHDLAQVFYGGMLVVEFGLRRGSSKDTGHGHLLDDLQLTLRQVLDLAYCPLSYEEWVAIMKEKGLIVEKEEDSDS